MNRKTTTRVHTPADGLDQALEKMELIRAFEERLLDLFSEGRLSGTTHTSIGQETCALAVVGALDLDRDIVFSTHRCHGHFIAYGGGLDGLMAEIMGRATGTVAGRGGSQHLSERNFYSNGVQGGIVPVATGMALAEKASESGAVTVCFIGDGTLGEGVLYESMNLAALWRIPVIYVVEHNRYAQSTPTAGTTAGDVEARARAFGIETDRRAADDPIELERHMRDIVARVRNDSQPFFQVLDTERLAAHSKGDDDRSPAELERIRKTDPLGRIRSQVASSAAVRTAARERIDAAVERALNAPEARVDPWAESRSFDDVSVSQPANRAFASASESVLVVKNMNDALHRLFDECGDVLLIGEDIADPYGGTFKVSRGLSSRFPHRVLSTPISEAGIVGLDTGMAMRGFRPIVEIMFGDFLTLASDQIVNHLAKFRWMYNDRVRTPMVIRTPMGGGRGYGPTHSQSLEKMFCGVPGLVTVAISRRHDPGELLRRAVVEDDRPVLFIEQKKLYGRTLQSDAPAGMTFELHPTEEASLYPTGVWLPLGADADVTVVAYGAMTDVAEEAISESFDEDEIVSEYIVPSQLAPLKLDPILDSVRRTGRLLVVEEGTLPWGFGAELTASVCEVLETPPRVARVGAFPLPIPNARSAEESVLPDAGRIVAAMRKLVR